MISRTFITFTAFLYIVVLPVLEISPSHVFSPSWPAHARLHHIWQLAANAGIALLALYLCWLAGRVRLASILLLATTASFIIAWITSGMYGGSLDVEPGKGLRVFGRQPAGILMTVLAVGLAISAIRREPE